MAQIFLLALLVSLKNLKFRYEIVLQPSLNTLMFKEILEKIKKVFSFFLRKFRGRLVFILFFFLLLDFLCAVSLFSRYYFRETKQEESKNLQLLQIDKLLLDKFSQEWVRRQSVFQAANNKDYPNSFQLSAEVNPIVLTVEPPSSATTTSSSEFEDLP